MNGTDMAMPTPSELVPSVESYPHERLTFWVRSRSGQPKYIVDMEEENGLGQCNCPAFRFRKIKDCWHIQQVRKLLSCSLAQQSILGK